VAIFANPEMLVFVFVICIFIIEEIAL